MDPVTRDQAYLKLEAIKEYIAYPEEILVDKNLEELYKGMEIDPKEYFKNSLSMGVWVRNYYWSKLREKVKKVPLHVCWSWDLH